MNGSVQSEGGRTRHIEYVLVVLSIVAIGLLYLSGLTNWLIEDDEGTFLYQCWRVSEGDRPYTDFFSSHWPLFLYTGGMLIDLFGRSVLALRVVTVALMLITAFLVFLLARRSLPAEAAWLAMIAFLLHPQAFAYGRFFYAEAFMLLWDAVGLVTFERGWNGRNRALLVVSSLCFALAALYKPFGALPFAGCLLWVFVDTWRHREDWRSRVVRAAVFALSFAVIMGLAVLVLWMWQPLFFSFVVPSHLVQGRDLGMAQLWGNGAVFVLRYVVAYLPFMLFVLPAAWVSNRKPVGMLAWQLPTVLGFFALSRELHLLRYLLYLLPSLAILFASALEPLRQWKARSFLLVAVVGAVLLPWVMTDVLLVVRSEGDTSRLAALIRARTADDAYVLSDYQEINFYAARRSTYLGSEISRGMAISQRITGKQLIEEGEQVGVEMILIHTAGGNPHHLVQLVDYDDFRAYVLERFDLVTVFDRADQQIEVYQRKAGQSK